MAKIAFPEYEAALKAADGSPKPDADGLLATACYCLSMVHAVNPGMLFNGAKKKGLSHRQVMKLESDNPVELAFLQFA